MRPKEISSKKDVISHKLEQQLRAVQIEKHREYLCQKWNEKACQTAKESDSQKEKSIVVGIAQNKRPIDVTIDQSAKRT